MFAVTFIISPARSSYSQTDLQLIRQRNTFHITWVLTNNKMQNGNWKWQLEMAIRNAAEAQKPKTFRVATFYAQKLSG